MVALDVQNVDEIHNLHPSKPIVDPKSIAQNKPIVADKNVAQQPLVVDDGFVPVTTKRSKKKKNFGH